MRVSEIELSPNYLIAKDADNADYIDVYQLKTSTLAKSPLPKYCMVAFFKSFSSFIVSMLLIRESIAKKIGLKMAPENTQEGRNKMLRDFEGNIGDSIEIFEVIDKNETELMTGQRDKHLDFKLSFISYESAGDKVIELATVVHIHNALGKVYFFFVKPFHRMIMKRIMRKMEKVLIQKELSENMTP